MNRPQSRAADVWALIFVAGIVLLGVELASRSIARVSLCRRLQVRRADAADRAFGSGPVMSGSCRTAIGRAPDAGRRRCPSARPRIRRRHGGAIASGGTAAERRLLLLRASAIALVRSRQDLANDYRLLGMGDKTHLFTPTPTGYAQSAWTIGPSSRLGAVLRHRRWRRTALAARGRRLDVRHSRTVRLSAWPGSSGDWPDCSSSVRLARATRRPESAGVATIARGVGSFVLWYLVKDRRWRTHRRWRRGGVHVAWATRAGAGRGGNGSSPGLAAG